MALSLSSATRRVSVEDRCDCEHRLGRQGTGWTGGVGLIVGLVSPPLLGSVAAGAATGGLIGKFAKRKVESGIESGLGDKLKPGTAAIIAIVDSKDRLAAEQALTDSPAKSVAQMDEKGLKGLKESLAGAAGKFTPDRTVLPIPDRSFGGTIGHTLDKSVADWTIVPGPKAPDDAPNVLVVLIDDAGFCNLETFGGLIRTPNLTRVQEVGLTYASFHVTALCSPTRAALLTGRNHHRVGFGSVAEFPGPFPGYSKMARPRSCTALHRRRTGTLRGGLANGTLPQTMSRVPQDRSRSLAPVVGLRPLLGVFERGSRPVRSHHHAG